MWHYHEKWDLHPTQFRHDYRAWCDKRGVRPRFGAVGPTTQSSRRRPNNMVQGTGKCGTIMKKWDLHPTDVGHRWITRKPRGRGALGRRRIRRARANGPMGRAKGRAAHQSASQVTDGTISPVARNHLAAAMALDDGTAISARKSSSCSRHQISRGHASARRSHARSASSRPPTRARAGPGASADRYPAPACA